jgi:hypothetical protein
MGASFYLEDSRDREGNRLACYIRPATGFTTPRIVIDVPHDVSPRDAITIAKAILDTATEMYRESAERLEQQTRDITHRLQAPEKSITSPVPVCGLVVGSMTEAPCSLPKGHTGPHVLMPNAILCGMWIGDKPRTICNLHVGHIGPHKHDY